MANTTFNTRIKLKYSTLTEWTTANPVLLKGEVAVVVVPADSGAVVQEPAVLFKVGDGTSSFNTLPYVSGIAADVHDWAKASTKPTYQAAEISGIGSYIADYVDKELGISVDTNTLYQVVATEDGMGFILQSKDKGTEAWTDVKTISFTEKFVKSIVTGTTNGTIKVDGTEVAVAGLKSAAFVETTAFDASGSAAQALTDAKAYANGLDTAMGTRVKSVEDRATALEGKVTTLIGDDADKSVRTIANEELAKQLIADGAAESLNTLQEIAQWIQDHPGDAAAMNEKIAALETQVGEGTVASQIDAKITALDLANTYEEKGAAAVALTEANAYTDGKDTAMNTRVEALEAKFGAGEGNVESQIAAAVAAEKAEREAAVAGVQKDVDAIAADYLKAADKTELEGKITTAQSKADAAQTHSEGVAADLATEVAVREALSTTVSTHTNNIADIVKKNEDQQVEIDALEGLVGTTKVSEQIAAAVEGANLDQYATKTALATTQAEVDAVEALVGEKAVATQISEAIAAENLSQYAKVTDLTALDGRVTTAEGKVATLETEMDAVEGRATALETEVAKKADTADLHKVATSGLISDLEQTEDTYIVFDCGSATKNI